ncbi:MAG: molybdopterin molybdotransferase MoeA [Thaumarchaeota archaeon]|nr:molybdopterin molybdotransferase MoeA [Nitrososphaerota archaeon]
MKTEIAYTDVDEALSRLFAEVKLAPSAETVPVERAYGRIILEDLVSDMDIPVRNTSHVDGFAVRADDTVGASETTAVSLRLVGSVDLVEVPAKALGKGEAIKVRTGSYLPEGCDDVVPKEYATVEGATVAITRPASKGREVVRGGSDIKRGDVILRRGHRIRAQDAELAKILGHDRMVVSKPPLAAIISVGSELTDDPKELSKGKILATHDIVVKHMVEAAGGATKDLGIIPDDLDAISRAISSGLEETQMALTIGGSSVGEADLVSGAINKIGRPGVVVHGLKLQPGRVAGFGVIGGKPVFILPGLIQSTVNAFVFLAYPFMRHLLGLRPARREGVVYARMTESIEFKRWQDFRKVTWVKVYEEEHGLMAQPVRGESPMFNVLVHSTGYILTPEHRQRIEKGDTVAVNLAPGISSLGAFAP